MNKLVKFGLIAGGAVSLYFLWYSGSATVTKKDLMELADAELPDSYDHEIEEKYDIYTKAKSSAEVIRKKFSTIRSAEKSTAEYKLAKLEEDTAKKAFEAAKKAVNSYKPDSTQVAVGSGNSAVAINIQDSSQKVALDTAMREAQSKYDTAKNHREMLDNAIDQKVLEVRTSDDNDILSAERDTYQDYQRAVKAKSNAIDEIISNETWRNKKLSDIYKRTVTETDIIGEAIGLSAFPAAVLVYIWANAYNKIKLLKEV